MHNLALAARKLGVVIISIILCAVAVLATYMTAFHWPPRNMPMNLKELEQYLKSLLHGEYTALILSFNKPNAPNYQTVQEYAQKGFDDGWINEKEKNLSIQNNSKWTIQWYPHTPAGFRIASASTLRALINHLPSN